MPIRCISRTTSRPKSVRPPAAFWSVAESAQPTLALWVRVMYRTPSAYSMRSTPSDPAMAWPPSAPSSDATRPEAKTRSTSAAVSASSRARGYAAIIRRARSICSSTVVTAVSPASEAGT